MIYLRIDDLKIVSVLVIKASRVCEKSLNHKRNNTRIMKD